MEDAPAPSGRFRIGLSPEQLDTAFPFHLAVDRDLRIVQSGHSLQRLYPSVANGVLLQDLFLLKRPEIPLSFSSLASFVASVSLWEDRQSGMLFRGQMMATEGDKSLLFLWSPWLSDNADLGRFGLSLNDFALHDPVVDLLQVLQSHKIAFQDVQALAVKLSAQRTELKQANQELNRQFALLAEAKELLQRKEHETRKLALIVSHTDNAVVLTDATGRVEWVNEGFTRVTGYVLSEVLGKRPGAFLQGQHTDPETIAYMRQQIAKREGFTAEVLNYKKSGDEYWIHIEVRPIRDELGEVTNYMAIQRDVTRHREYERALVQAKREADSANQAKSEFLATMSHEIRSPMTAILGTLELLRSSRLDVDQDLWSRTAYESAEALLKIIDDILDFSKVEAGKLELHDVSFELEPLLEDILLLFRPRSDSKQLELALSIAPGVPKAIRSDPFRLRQILINLIGNALKFTDRGKIEVKVGHQLRGGPKPLIRFEVKDTGIGISKDAADTLFNEFVQLENGNTRRFGGTGLGLAICKRLAGLMGGEIGVDSQPGVGSSFWFTIGFMPDNSEIFPPRPKGLAHVRLPTPEGPGGRILLAEDGEAIRLVISSLLINSGYQVHAVNNGKAAVEALQSGEYDLVLMDGQMPVMSGSEATRAIRALPGERGRIPILALTANALLENRNACLAAGMDDFITKPVEKARLLEKISQWLNRPADPATPGEEAEGMPDLAPILDNQALLDLAENTDESVVRQTIGVFFSDAAERAQRIAVARETFDMDALELESHTIKAGARIVGAIRLGDAANGLETACLRGDWNGASELADEVLELFQLTRDAYLANGLL